MKERSVIQRYRVVKGLFGFQKRDSGVRNVGLVACHPLGRLPVVKSYTYEGCRHSLSCEGAFQIVTPPDLWVRHTWIETRWRVKGRYPPFQNYIGNPRERVFPMMMIWYFYKYKIPSPQLSFTFISIIRVRTKGSFYQDWSGLSVEVWHFSTIPLTNFPCPIRYFIVCLGINTMCSVCSRFPLSRQDENSTYNNHGKSSGDYPMYCRSISK